MTRFRGVPPHRSLRRHKRSALVLTVSLFLSGCATFSPDRGMGVVADIADTAIRKDVAAIRSVEDAQRTDDAVKRLLHRTGAGRNRSRAGKPAA